MVNHKAIGGIGGYNRVVKEVWRVIRKPKSSLRYTHDLRNPALDNVCDV